MAEPRSRQHDTHYYTFPFSSAIRARHVNQRQIRDSRFNQREKVRGTRNSSVGLSFHFFSLAAVSYGVKFKVVSHSDLYRVESKILKHCVCEKQETFDLREVRDPRGVIDRLTSHALVTRTNTRAWGTRVRSSRSFVFEVFSTISSEF